MGNDRDISGHPFHVLVENAPDAIVVSRDGVVLYVNQAAIRLLGYEHAAEIEGQPMRFLDDEALGMMRQRIQQMIATGEHLAPREYPATRKNGDRITAEIASSVVHWDGKPAVLAYARDVTERVQLRAQVAHADRLASLGTMAAGVAHEINNPLSFVALAIDKLRHLMQGETERALVADVRSGLERVAAIVNDLKVFGRYEDGAPSPTDLGVVIDAAERLTAHELRTKATIIRRYESAPLVMGNAPRLEQVFVNLFLNAAQAMPADYSGQIIVSIEAGENVVVLVQDNGRGIPPSELALIFEPFFTNRLGGGGTGLGLSICRDILLRAGGDLTVTSEVGVGTEMRLRLRASGARISDAPRSQRRSSAHPSRSPAPSRRARVLIVDDDPRIVEMTVAMLLEEGVDAEGASDPQAALGRILEVDSFDAVVCDLMMPGLPGMDVYDRVARERPGREGKFIFVTGGAYTSHARGFLERVPNARLAKPYTIDDLRAAISRLCS